MTEHAISSDPPPDDCPAAAPAVPPDEPRGATLWDWLFLVPGVAVPWSLPGWQIGPQTPMAAAYFVVVLTSQILITPAFVVGAVLIGRQIRYHRRPRPAEWLSVLFMSAYAATIPPNLDTSISWLAPWFGVAGDRLVWSTWRWQLGGLAAAVAVPVIASGLTAGWRHPRWWQTAQVAGGLMLLFWGPLAVMAIEGPWFAFFPANPAWAGWSEWNLVLRDAFWNLPWAVLFGISAVAVLRDWRRRGTWRWTEWLSVISAATLLLAFTSAVACFSAWQSAVASVLSLAAALWIASWIVKRWSRYDRCGGGSGGAASTSTSGGSWPAAQ